MKRVAAALVLLLTAVVIAVWSGYIFHREFNTISKSLDSLIVISETENTEKLKKETENLYAQWEKSSKLLHSFVLHSGMDEIENIILELPMLAEHSSVEKFRERCIEAKGRISNLIDSEKVSFENVF